MMIRIFLAALGLLLTSMAPAAAQTRSLAADNGAMSPDSRRGSALQVRGSSPFRRRASLRRLIRLRRPSRRSLQNY
jgi:hypothetical protein